MHGALAGLQYMQPPGHGQEGRGRSSSFFGADFATFHSAPPSLKHWSHQQEGVPEQRHWPWQSSPEAQSGVNSAESPGGRLATTNVTNVTQATRRDHRCGMPYRSRKDKNRILAATIGPRATVPLILLYRLHRSMQISFPEPAANNYCLSAKAVDRFSSGFRSAPSVFLRQKHRRC